MRWTEGHARSHLTSRPAGGVRSSPMVGRGVACVRVGFPKNPRYRLSRLHRKDRDGEQIAGRQALTSAPAGTWTQGMCLASARSEPQVDSDGTCRIRRQRSRGGMVRPRFESAPWIRRVAAEAGALSTAIETTCSAKSCPGQVVDLDVGGKDGQHISRRWVSVYQRHDRIRGDDARDLRQDKPWPMAVAIALRFDWTQRRTSTAKRSRSPICSRRSRMLLPADTRSRSGSVVTVAP